jgi:hypothetical protein
MVNKSKHWFFFPPFTIHQVNPPKHFGSVGLHIERARARNHVAQAREVESNDKREQRLQVQASFQTPHITAMRAIESFVQANERLQV